MKKNNYVSYTLRLHSCRRFLYTAVVVLMTVIVISCGEDGPFKVNVGRDGTYKITINQLKETISIVKQ